MERILNQFHNKETFLYSLSIVFERASYYGLRSIIVLYMVGESLRMTDTEALKIYGWFTGSLIFYKIIGALLGDLVIGNKKSIILGGIIQAIGAFCFCIPSTMGLYIGLFLVVLGDGLYSPNIFANYGKLYLNKTKLLDAGFTMHYLAINIGSFIGVLLIGYAGEKYSWNLGFMLSGMLMLFSIIPILISKEEESHQENPSSTSLISRRAIIISVTVVLVGLYWVIQEISNIRVVDLQTPLSGFLRMDITESMFLSLSPVIILTFSVLAIILWTYFYSSQFFKLTVGFIFGAISYGILFLIPEIPNEQHLIIYLVSLFFLGISEVYITPIIHSVLTKYTNPKYLAIMISIAFIPSKVFSVILGLFNEGLSENPLTAIKIGMLAMVFLSIGMLIYLLGVRGKKNTYNEV